MSLRRLYNLREMSINVPDQDVKALKGVVKQAVQLGILPSDAPAWFPKSGKAGEVQPSSEPKQKTKDKGDKGKKEKEPAKPPPVPLSPDAKAQIDKSAGAWDKLANVGAAPQQQKVSQPWKALQGTGFDSTHADVGGDYGKDFPQFAEPKSAVTKVGKDAKPDDAVDWSAGAKKPGMLSRLFGKKKQDRFTDNPYEFEPEAPPAKQGPSKDAHARMKQFAHSDEPPPIPGKDDKEDAVGDLKSFLGTHQGDRERGGKGTMDDLKWDLKRSKGKR